MTMRQALIAEDNPAQQLLLRKLVSTLDPELRIQVVDSYDGAVAALSDSTSRFEWVLSDLFLIGEKTGVDLYKFCKSAHPGTQVALISGARPCELTELLADVGGAENLISKSRSVPELRALLSTFLGAGSPAADPTPAAREALIRNLLFTLVLGAGLLLTQELHDSLVGQHPAQISSVGAFSRAPLIQAFRDPGVQEAVSSLLKGGLTPLLRGKPGNSGS